MTTQIVHTKSFSGSDTSFTAPGTLRCIENITKHNMIKQSQNLLSVLKVKDINDCVTKMYPAFNPQIANMFM